MRTSCCGNNGASRLSLAFTFVVMFLTWIQAGFLNVLSWSYINLGMAFVCSVVVPYRTQSTQTSGLFLITNRTTWDENIGSQRVKHLQ
jgi:hypothetical protein